MPAYYNEIEPYAAQWLRNLIAAGLIASGDVDERSIVDVRPDDLTGYTQCHFFAGLGGWSYALRLAGWPDDRPMWTGSCPCQPFSAAGKGGGFADERHLWPSWFHLISICRPPVIVGEQVASGPAGAWCDLVQDDLEALGYAFGAVPLPAASVDSPHIRDRLWWVADASRAGLPPRERQDLQGEGWGREGRAAQQRGEAHGGLVGPARWAGADDPGWADPDWLFCRDGKWRPVEPGTFPLAHGVPARVGRLRAYGNAIAPQVAAEFIRAYLDCRP
ncbi:DNA cytosine methyltransferase [Xanthobacter sp. V2C-8]|uniref:DNA cytosine methyltransferase n=1 Tax=Xanthobacter albus TaxID=3119929 RepID=UPI003728C047